MVRLPRQDDFRNFCMSDETEKVYQELEEVIRICWESKKAEPFDKEVLPFDFLLDAVSARILW